MIGQNFATLQELMRNESWSTQLRQARGTVEVYDPEGDLLKFYFVKGRVFAVWSIGLLLASNHLSFADFARVGKQTTIKFKLMLRLG